jgi:hypothetical protein
LFALHFLAKTCPAALETPIRLPDLFSICFLQAFDFCPSFAVVQNSHLWSWKKLDRRFSKDQRFLGPGDSRWRWNKQFKQQKWMIYLSHVG